MANIVGLNNDNLIRSDYIYDANQGKSQSEINSSVSSSISSLNSNIEIRTQATECNGTIDAVVSTLSRTKGGRIGSSYVYASGNIPEGWYNFVWMTHRVGNTGSGDNHQYGTLLLTPMNFTPNAQLYIVHWCTDSITQIFSIAPSATLYSV